LSFSAPRLVMGKVAMVIVAPSKAKPPPVVWRRRIPEK
jgi:hypothetical protein